VHHRRAARRVAPALLGVATLELEKHAPRNTLNERPRAGGGHALCELDPCDPMPFSEILSSVALTYASSEFLYGSKARGAAGLGGVCLIQLAGWATTLHFSITTALPRNIPLVLKVPIVALLFTAALWVDCGRYTKLDVNTFAKELGSTILLFVPIFPWVAIIISFFFFLAVSVLDFVGLPVDFLNWPIYYGTLYGPFSLVYMRVKRRISQRPVLPRARSG